MRTVGSRLESTQKAFGEVVGLRTRGLDRQVERVEQIRIKAGLNAEALPDGDETLELDEASGDVANPPENGRGDAADEADRR